MDRLSEREKVRIAELVAVGAPAWKLHREVHRSRWAIRWYVNRLQRPSPPARSGRRCGCRWPNGRRSRGAWPVASRCVRSRFGWVDRPRRSRGRCMRTAASGAIGRVGRTVRRCGGLDDRSRRSSRNVHGCGGWWSTSSNCVGRRSRSPVGWCERSPTMRRCACRTRRSISRCSCSLERVTKELTRHLRRGHVTRQPRGHSIMNGQGQLHDTINIRDDPPKPTIGPCPATGKAT